MSQLEQSTSDFLQQLAEYQGEYASDRDFSIQKKIREQEAKEQQGAELLNVAAPSAFKIFSRGLERGQVAGKITKTLDDYEQSLSPASRSTFRLVRNVASDIIGAAPGKLGEVARNAEDVIRGNPAKAQEQAPEPTAEEQESTANQPLPEPEPATEIEPEPEPAPAASEAASLASERPADVVPLVNAKLRQLGFDKEASDLENAARGSPRAAFKRLQDSSDPEAQDLASRWKSAVARVKQEKPAQVAPNEAATAPEPAPARDEFAPDLIPSGAGGRVNLTTTPEGPATAAVGAGEEPVPAPRAVPDVAPGFRVLADVTRGDLATAGDVATAGLGLAAGELSGRAEEAVSGTAIGLTTARELAAGELPTGALLAGVDAGLARLGTPGREAAQGLNLGVSGANVARQVGSVVSRLTGRAAATESVDPAISAQSTAEQMSGQAAKLLGRNAADKVGDLATAEGGEAGEIATAGGDAGEGVVSTLSDAALGSLAGDENPIGWTITAGLGLAAGLTALGESIKDIFGHHHSHPMVPVAKPVFQAGIGQ